MAPPNRYAAGFLPNRLSSRPVARHRRWPLIPLLVLVTMGLGRYRLWAQGETTSAIRGQVVDASGAAIPGAQVSLAAADNGMRRGMETDAAGRFYFPQLKPGDYSVSATKTGFQPGRQNVNAGLGQSQEVKLALRVAVASQSVEVSGAAPLIATSNPNTTTTFGSATLENLPNPGGDLTYPLQFAPGALVNTAGSGNDFIGGTNGYGNVQFNGLSAVSNGYIVDGVESNDPLTNLNSGLSTNLVLGLNSIAQVSVNTLSYALDEGRYGASQVDYVTKSGGNQFHGNLYELWNGARLNAADFFTNATNGNQKPGSTVNHFGGSLGGPIKKNKLFFFFDSEWVRIALPIVTTTTVPTPALESYALQQLPLGGTDPITGSTYAPAPTLAPFYKQMFWLYPNTAGTPLAMLGCPFNTGGGAASGAVPDGNGCANRQSVSHSSDDHEEVQTLRIDQNISANRTAWYRFQSDTGLQAAYTDPINPVFDAISPQPLYSLAAGYTQVVSSHLVNYLNPGFSWYESLFGPRNLQQTLAAFPILLQATGAEAPFTPLGGLDNTWVQGRRAARLFINDNLAYTAGAHEFRLGANVRILRLNDYDFGEGAVPSVTYTDLPELIHGVAATATATYSVANSQPYNFLNVDLYGQDTWSVTRTLTWTFGLRTATNTNPLNPHGVVARLSSSFASARHDVYQPLNEAITTNLQTVFAATPLVMPQPRTALAWQARPGTVLRAGVGVFSDLLPGSVVDQVGANPPYSVTLQGGLQGTVGGVGIAPGVANSAVGATAAAAQAFQDGFAVGELSCASPLANPAACLPPVSLTAVPAGRLKPPYDVQWSLGLERQLGANAAFQAQYVGTRALDQPYSTQVNGYQTVCPGCFAPFPYGTPPDPRFGAVTQLQTGATSNYDGLQLTVNKRMGHGLQAQLNYTWSHCLDEVSNGGFLPFSAGAILSPLPGELRRQYGPCDYDVRHNFTASYVYQLPFKTRRGGLRGLVNGWQVSGTVFLHSGLPFSVLSTPYSANGEGIMQGGGPQYANMVPGVPLYDHNSIPGLTQPGTVQWLSPNAFASAVDPSTGACVGGDSAVHCQFGALGRNALRGPDFVWSDLYLTKWFTLNQRAKLRMDVQVFNLFNHPNFALPSDVYAGVPGQPATQVGFGALTYLTSPPTGLLGVGLGGDSAPRMVALQARIEF